MQANELRRLLQNGDMDPKLAHIYACEIEGAKVYRDRILSTVDSFEEKYGQGRELHIFSAPGRTEVGGNHTDHQHGRVLAASVNLDVIAVASPNADGMIRVKSKGFDEDVLAAGDYARRPEEANRSVSVIRGIMAKFDELGCSVGGFDAYTTSSVLAGSGLSSSAAFEVLIGNIVNTFYFNGAASPIQIAQIGQYAENEYFGKPSGLLDQAASSVGGFVAMDFENPSNPIVEQVDFDFSDCGYALCIIDTKGSHSDLTPDYAAVPAEMKAVAACFGKSVLREVEEEEFFRRLPELREKVSDRALLRAIHFFEENRRAGLEAEALKNKDFDGFKRLVLESGRSSFCYLQNVYSSSHPETQGVSLALALCERYLSCRNGSWRVHGGGFAGTVQAYVPIDFLSEFVERMEAFLGTDSCHILQIRPVGGLCLL